MLAGSWVAAAAGAAGVAGVMLLIALAGAAGCAAGGAAAGVAVALAPAPAAGIIAAGDAGCGSAAGPAACSVALPHPCHAGASDAENSEANTIEVRCLVPECFRNEFALRIGFVTTARGSRPMDTPHRELVASPSVIAKCLMSNAIPGSYRMQFDPYPGCDIGRAPRLAAVHVTRGSSCVVPE